MTGARLAFSMLLRDWRAGELRVLALALVLAVGGVSSVAFFADRVRQSLTREAHQVLGADVLLTADHAWSAKWREEIAKRGLAGAESMSFVSMTRAGGEALLSAVKAVTPGYPLRGKLRAAPALNAADAETTEVPPPGTVWLDERLTAALKVGTGDTIELGGARFRVAAVLTLEPDRGVSFMNFAPRLMMNIRDLPATGLVQPGSRISYQLLAAGGREEIRQFEQWAAAQLSRGERMESLENARPEVRAGLDRAQSFLGLTAMLAVVLSSVAIALGTRRYTSRHLDGYAVMRCLGAGQPQLFALFAWEFCLLALAASLAGCALGFAVQNLVAWWLAALVPGSLPQPGPAPLLQGAATGFAVLLGFALPPLLQLKGVPALRVIRRDVGPPRQSALALYAFGFAAVFALLWWQAGDVKLGSYVFGGFAAAFVLFAAIGYGALRLIGRFGRTGSASWRYGLANLLRRPRANTVQIVALAVGLAAILLLTLIRADLLDSWRRRLPPDAPDRFLVNIQPDQRQPLAEFFAGNRVKQPETFPMVRARLVAINDRPVGAADYTDERAKRQIEREFNLTYLKDLPEGNKVTDGAWFTPQELTMGAMSVEFGIAERLGIRRGDRLEFVAAGQATFSAPATSIRRLDWDSMRPNFFFIATPKLLQDFPASYVTSFRAPAGDAALTLRLSQAFPNITVIDVSFILRQLQIVMDQLIGAVQLVFLFALAAGVLVLYAALLATQDERTHEAAVMRALGASRAQVLGALRAEFAVLGLIAGLLGSVGATAIGWALATRVFQLEFIWNGWIWIAGPALGLACIVANAWAGARAALSRPPMAALRESA